MTKKTEYIQYKGNLLTRYEWAQGGRPLSREFDARWREVKRGSAVIVEDFK